MTIGQLAKRSGETVRTLRYYDKIGLLKPSDYKAGGHRLYSLDNLNRLQQIQSLKFIGFSLKDVANLLELQQTNQQHLSQSIAFKKRELLAQLEEIQRTIDQLDHMDTIISDQEHVDLSVFCFILHSILWEENNYTQYHQIENSILNITSVERIELDKEYFSLFSDLKQLVANKVSSESKQAMAFMQRLITLQQQTFSKIEGLEIESKNQTEQQNILDPFTEEERIFLESAFAMMTTGCQVKGDSLKREITSS